MAGTLIICSTPIGNLGDVSERLGAALAGADLVYAEDTRRTGKLLAVMGITTPLRSYFLGNEQQRSSELAERLERGETIALVSDAGTPVVSDPGLSAVRAAEKVGAEVTVVPGPSAVTALLAVSGFSGDRFVFEGFLPRKGDERAARVSLIGGEERTVIFFSTGNRLYADLTDISNATDPGRLIVVGRELTKLHEQVWRGTLAESLVAWEAGARGEISVAIEGATTPSGSVEAAVHDVLKLIEDGSSMSDAVKAAAQRHHLKRSDVYDAALAARSAR